MIGSSCVFLSNGKLSINGFQIYQRFTIYCYVKAYEIGKIFLKYFVSKFGKALSQ